MTSKHQTGADVLVTTRSNALLPTFPGWGHPEEFDHFRAVEPGEHGVITGVESHGQNPWTRYSILLDDGSRLYGVGPNEIQTARFTVEDYDSADGNWFYCVVDNQQTGSDGGPLIVDLYETHEAASVVRDNHEGLYV